MSFSFEQEKNVKLPLSRQQGKFVTTFYMKAIFSGVFTHFNSIFASGL